MSDIGRTLAKLRQEAGLPIDEAAHRAGTTAGELFSAERGMSPLDEGTVKRLTQVYSAAIGEQISAADSARLSRRDSRPCDINVCLDDEHPYVDGEMDADHCAIRIGSNPPYNEAFLVQGTFTEESGLWEAFANVDLDEIQGVEGLVAAERFLLAYRTVHEHCEHLNQLERSTR
ncbi:helix-turn-helix transcriptional regulator [Leucobacter allii]|uniref:Helix-turn-helix transcriptional regulator n=1 Tax=Leucobacter allii TaxID=2932247 RepID=A0ABY4FJA3_9MICO|nr:helix-turn-helix transcriptional regulator [Leucobacter allii]UOQ56052.1 helix-turn-helix transcriptional regulator [Leucobacter allii]